MPKAVFNKDAKIKFYSIIDHRSAGSSVFKLNSKFVNIDKIPHKEIVVEATRIDTWAKERGIDKIDLCWVDLQGVEYEALEGMGDLIFNIQTLFVELELQELYIGQKLYEDVVNFLKEKGFTLIKYLPVVKNLWGNAIFLNDNLEKKS